MSGFSSGTLSPAKKRFDEGLGIAKIEYFSFRFFRTILLLAYSLDENVNITRKTISVNRLAI